MHSSSEPCAHLQDMLTHTGALPGTWALLPAGLRAARHRDLPSALAALGLNSDAIEPRELSKEGSDGVHTAKLLNSDAAASGWATWRQGGIKV